MYGTLFVPVETSKCEDGHELQKQPPKSDFPSIFGLKSKQSAAETPEFSHGAARNAGFVDGVYRHFDGRHNSGWHFAARHRPGQYDAWGR